MLHRIYHWVLKSVFKNAIWQLASKANGKEVYLTFDDGPHPEITPWVIDQLANYQAKATFFCIGKNAQKYPEVLTKIRDNGHAIGHHTQNHVHGWKTSIADYKNEVLAASEKIQTTLFRPPYGKLSWAQYRWVSKGYKLIMWSILSRDYDKKKSPAYCVNRVLNRVKSGDIIVFHDSEKAQKNLYGALPKILGELQQRGFQFKVIK